MGNKISAFQGKSYCSSFQYFLQLYYCSTFYNYTPYDRGSYGIYLESTSILLNLELFISHVTYRFVKLDNTSIHQLKFVTNTTETARTTIRAAINLVDPLFVFNSGAKASAAGI